MRIAFYAPLKPPDHPVPSGDRRVARLLMAALAAAGHQVDLACHLRARDGKGDPEIQEKLGRLGGRIAGRLTARWEREPALRPDLWFTYHLYYKAADWIGPLVAERLAIPYVVAEASVAMKRAGGPWDRGHRQTLRALDGAARVFAMTRHDSMALEEHLTAGRVTYLPPFLETSPYAAASASREDHRAALTARFTGAGDGPLLLAVGMMREGDKLRSYQLLSAALAHSVDLPWRLAIVGDGPAAEQVRHCFAGLPSERIAWLGAVSEAALPPLYAGADLMVWPAIREAYGMALLEAQATGLPVLAGAAGGVPDIVVDGETGSLVPEGDRTAYADRLRAILRAPECLEPWRRAAQRKIEAGHGIHAASRLLDRDLSALARSGRA